MSGEESADLPNAGWRPGGAPSLPEYFGLKGEQPGVGVPPRIGGQSRFAGKIGQGGFAVPVLFGRDLRQEYRAFGEADRGVLSAARGYRAERGRARAGGAVSAGHVPAWQGGLDRGGDRGL